MRGFIPAVVLAGVLLAAGAQGEGEPALKYKVEVEKVLPPTFQNQRLEVTVAFKVRRLDDGAVATDVSREEIVVKEDGKIVKILDISQPKVDKLTTVLAMDISGSMDGRTGGKDGPRKIDEAKRAAHTFLDGLHAKAETGLILFDHLMRVEEVPLKDPEQFAKHRGQVRQHIDAAKPGGGTAYLDAANRAVQMIKPLAGRKAVLVMTDGVDMNSERSLDTVIKNAKAVGVPIYTIGIGDAGKNDPVTTVLVLDHSLSMKEKASDTDEKSKIEALHEAASRFVKLMRSNARTTLLPFSSRVEEPDPFSANKGSLEARIRNLQPQGGTLLYDATYAGIETLLAERPKGKKAVIVLTDGKDEDPGSRHSDDAVIQRAKEAGVPIYLLGLGRPEEINEAVMKRMADETGGKYRHAGNQQRLIELFEELSIDLHDDGIDEPSLRRLAEETGGKYVHVSDVSKLQLEFQKLSEELQSTYTVTFASERPKHDGTARGIDVSLVRGGVQVSDVGSADYNVRGVVVPEMDSKIYLFLLVLVGGLLLAPAGVRRLQRRAGS